MKNGGIIFTGIVIAAYLAYKSTNKVVDDIIPSYRFREARIRYRDHQVIFALDIIITNPTKETITLKSFEGELSFNEISIAPISLTFLNKGNPISPSQTIRILPDIYVNVPKLPSGVLSLLPLLENKEGDYVKPIQPIALKVAGLLQFTNFQIPVNQTIIIT